MKMLSVLAMVAALYLTSAVACAPAGGGNSTNNDAAANRAAAGDNAAANNASGGGPNANAAGGAGNVTGATAADSQVELKARFSRAADGRLVVRYEATNRGGGEVFLLNRVPARNAGGYTFTAANYYLVPGADGVVEIGKRAYLLPPDSPAGAAGVALPAATRLAAGQTFSEEFSVAVPFRIVHPHREAARVPALPDPADRVRFCLGVVGGAVGNVREDRSGGEAVVRLSATAIRGQQIVCGEVQNVGGR